MRLFRLRRGVTPTDLPPVLTATVPDSPASLFFVTAASVPLITRYVVLYDRVGDWGRGATMPPPMLSVCGSTRGQIEDAIRRDVASYLPPLADIRVIADLNLKAGQIRVSDAPAGTFSIRMVDGGARAPMPG